jgi:glycosyltransferase involved in cell wall biosynthesis
MEGWNLPEIAASLGVTDEVMFHPNLEGGKLGTGVPVSDLVELYNAADLFVLPSQVEGFGLPIAEAMSCGLPVLVTKYAAGWEIASPAGAGIPVADWETHKSGTRVANIDTGLLAKEILRLRRDPKRLSRMSVAGLERSQTFRWDAFRKALISNAEQAVQGYREAQTQDKDSQGVQASERPEATASEGAAPKVPAPEDGLDSGVEDR